MFQESCVTKNLVFPGGGASQSWERHRPLLSVEVLGILKTEQMLKEGYKTCGIL